VAARLDGLVAGDLPPAMARELAPHLAACASCRAEVASFRQLAADLRALPVTASVPRSWASIQWAIAAERRAQPLPWAAQVAALAAAGLLVAAALVRSSGAIADRLADLSASRLPATLAAALAASPSWRPLVLPGLFMLFGALAALVAWPLLAPAGRNRWLPASLPHRE